VADSVALRRSKPNSTKRRLTSLRATACFSRAYRRRITTISITDRRGCRLWTVAWHAFQDHPDLLPHRGKALSHLFENEHFNVTMGSILGGLFPICHAVGCEGVLRP
jgi:hypothetical protein